MLIGGPASNRPNCESCRTRICRCRDLAAAAGPGTGRFRRAPALIARPRASRAGMSDPLVKRRLESGELDLPLPGSGHTATRWRKLAAFAEIDVVAGRLADAPPI